MPTYILLTQFNADAIIDPQEMANLDKMVKKRVCVECTGVEWLDSYILLGRYDALDIFRASDNQTASKVAVIIRSFGHATTEVLPATSWSDFADALGDLGSGQDAAQANDDDVLVSQEDDEKSIKDQVDEASAESFPASDPPSYSPG
jgi:uncharacterized protein with GYD domain